MEDLLGKRVRNAAIAGWWTALVATAWLVIVWLAWMVLLRAQPDWILRSWGVEGVTWPEAGRLMLLFFGIMKVLLWAWVMVCVWLSIWARRLRKAN